MTPEATITIIENKGIAVVICGLVIFLAYKYFAGVLENSNETNKEILETLNKINNFLVNGYCRDEDLNLLIKLRGRYVILEYKWIIVKYVLNNHIKQNLEKIKLELKNYADSSSNRTLELLGKKASYQEIQKEVERINTILDEINEIIFPIFEDMAKQSLTFDEKLDIIRTIEIHFDKIESLFLSKLAI